MLETFQQGQEPRALGIQVVAGTGTGLRDECIQPGLGQVACDVLQESRQGGLLDRMLELAKLARVSEEHLRRLCQQSLGRSPIQPLTYLRVQHAAHLIATSEEKIEFIANSVGYLNPFAFSNTFKRMTGIRPTDYRARKRAL
ncbi:MAG: helix-turn-helix transcriptional regulator [Opitutaceae bacterium]